MAITIKHAQIKGDKPYWYTLERWDEGHLPKVIARGRQYALDHGGYISVTDGDGHVLFGTDPVDLDRCIASGGNRYFTQPSA